MALPQAIFLLCVVSFAWATRHGPYDQLSMAVQFEKWQKKFDRVYSDKTMKTRRFHIFVNNLKIIDHHNKKKSTFKMGINRFADQTLEEFSASRRRTIPRTHNDPITFRNEKNLVPPPSKDWTHDGGVTEVKAELNCGMCWAFAALAAVEWGGWNATGELWSLSAQEILDCNNGMSTKIFSCDSGGSPEDAYDFIKKVNGGIAIEAEYPYVGKQQHCSTLDLGWPSSEISDYVSLVNVDEIQLEQIVAARVVTANIITTSDNFKSYKSGVIRDCGVYDANNLDHTVAIVGYGFDEETKLNFWYIKNSWGAGWGMSGYAMIEKDSSAQGGACWIATGISYPIAVPGNRLRTPPPPRA